MESARASIRKMQENAPRRHWSACGHQQETTMRMMMKSMIAGAVVSLAVMAASGPANAVVCGNSGATTLAQIMSLGSCIVDDKMFSAFSYSGDGTGVTDPANVGVGAVGANTSSPGLQFNAGWSAPAGGNNTDATIGFSVALLPGGTSLIDDATHP
jgi:hypothetical protein